MPHNRLLQLHDERTAHGFDFQIQFPMTSIQMSRENSLTLMITTY